MKRLLAIGPRYRILRFLKAPLEAGSTRSWGLANSVSEVIRGQSMELSNVGREQQEEGGQKRSAALPRGRHGGEGSRGLGAGSLLWSHQVFSRCWLRPRLAHTV